MAECQELLISFGSRRTASSICRCVISSPPITKDPVHARRLRRELHWETQQCLA